LGVPTRAHLATPRARGRRRGKGGADVGDLVRGAVGGA
jgi:hypothetical protein